MIGGKRQAGRERFAPRSVAAVSVLLVAVLLVSGCGDTAGLRDELESLALYDSFGGALARLYGDSGNDRAFDAAEVDGRLTVVGSTETELGVDGLLLEVELDGSIATDRAKFQNYNGHADEVFTSLGYATAGLPDDQNRLIVAGWRGDPADAVIIQLAPGGVGLETPLTFGGSLSEERISDLTASGNFAVGTSTAFHFGGTPFFVEVSYEGYDGFDGPEFLDTGMGSSANAVTFSQEADFVIAGSITTGAGIDALLFTLVRFDRSLSGSVRYDAGGNEQIYSLATLSDPDRIVAVGSTDAYFDGATAWLVIIIDAEDLSVEAGYAIRIDSEMESVARSVTPVDEVTLGPLAVAVDVNELVAISGDENQSALLATDGSLIWGAARSAQASIEGGAAAIVPARGGGLLAAGTDRSREHDEVGLLWVLPLLGTSDPHTVAATEAEVLDISADLTGPTEVATTVRDAATIDTDSVIPGNTYTYDTERTFADLSDLDFSVTLP